MHVQKPVHTYNQAKGFAPVCLAVRLYSIIKATLQRKKKTNEMYMYTGQTVYLLPVTFPYLSLLPGQLLTNNGDCVTASTIYLYITLDVSLSSKF